MGILFHYEPGFKGSSSDVRAWELSTVVWKEKYLEEELQLLGDGGLKEKQNKKRKYLVTPYEEIEEDSETEDLEVRRHKEAHCGIENAFMELKRFRVVRLISLIIPIHILKTFFTFFPIILFFF